jgi:hypothetical protein
MANTTFSGPVRAGNGFQTLQAQHLAMTLKLGQAVMSQSILIDAAVAAGTTTYNVGVDTKKLTTTYNYNVDVAIASDQGTTVNCFMLEKQELHAYLDGILTLKRFQGESTTLA